MSQFWSDIVHQLTPYVPGEQPKIVNLVKLNTNENPYGPSPKAIAAMQQALGEELKLYPDPNCDVLKAAIADYYSEHAIRSEQVFVGNGSDEVLAHVFCGLLKHAQPILFPDISYSFYPVYCGLYQVPFEQVPLTDSFEIAPEDYAKPNGGIIFPNPNAPTGRLLPLAAVKQILDANKNSVVVVDEAYIDFGGVSAVALVNYYPNLLVVQTLSKSRSLAGLRVGLAIGQAHLIEALERVKNSFNSYPLGRMELVGAAAAFADRDYFEQTTQKIIQSREQLTAELTELGFEVQPSAANFVFAKHASRDGGELAQALRERAVIVRHFKVPRIEQYLRITIGTDAQNQALVDALKAIL